MNISVVVIAYNEGANIGACLDSMLTQDYPADRYEVIVVDGGSIDGTRKIVEERAVIDRRVKLVIERKQGAAAGRNAGVNVARYEYVAFTDADCEVPTDWLSRLADNYVRIRSVHSSVAGVGGRNIAPRCASGFVKALEIALDSYAGSFTSIQGRQFTRPVFVPSLSTANVLYDKRRIADIGLFDETLKSEAEDAELNWRLLAAGDKLFFVPESFVWHKMRPTPRTWLRNMFRYGKGRGRLLKRYPAMWNLSYILPLLFIGAFASLALVPFSHFFYMPLAYFPAIFLFSIFKTTRHGSIRLAPMVALVYFIQHLSYSCGELYGLVNPKIK